MNLKENFKDLYHKYLKNIILKSLVYSLLIGGVVLFALSFVFWILNIHAFWIALIAFVVSALITFGISFLIMKPTDVKFARQLDELGLAQRVITMNEFKNDDSLMARIQRENAISHINKVDKKLLKAAIHSALTISMSVVLVFAIAATTLCALSANGVIDNGGDIIDDIIPGVKTTYEVSYDVDGEGYIDGEMFQVVVEGEDATAVMAVAEDGWAFVKWSDGLEDPYRCDLAIGENLTLTAEFGELDEQSQDGEPGDGESEDGDQDATEKDGKPSDSSSDKQSSQSDQNGDDPGQGMGGSYEPNNQVIDGETYYGDSTYDEYYNETMNSLQQDGQISDDVKSIIGDYYDNIEQ